MELQKTLRHTEAPSAITGRTGCCPGFEHLLETQSSANFAMVMSTGIVSVALHLLGWQTGAYALFWINGVMFAVLCVLYLMRLIRYPAAMRADFSSHGAGPGFLTIVAGTCILGNQFALLGHAPEAALMLFTMGVLLWVLFLFGVFVCIFTVSPKPSLAKGMNGAWLVATVSTQAIVILGTILAKGAGWDLETAFFFLSGLFALGFVLYLLVIGLIFHRFCFEDLDPEDLSPTYWINAGAVAITTLAGSELIVHAGEAQVLRDLMPFLKGLTLMAWSTATFWIPMLFLLGIWRHMIKGSSFAYTPAYWGMVFPMGMYTACTIMLAKAFDLPALMSIPEGFIFVAVAAWAITFVGMVLSLRAGLAGTLGKNL